MAYQVFHPIFFSVPKQCTKTNYTGNEFWYTVLVHLAGVVPAFALASYGSSRYIRLVLWLKTLGSKLKLWEIDFEP